MTQRLCLAFFIFFGRFVSAADISHLLSESEFVKYSHQIAHKVDLFREIWIQDPQREFFGGAVRDYLYWLKNSLLTKTENREQALNYIQLLLETPTLSSQIFLHPQSDLDTLNGKSSLVISPNWTVSRVENSSNQRFVPGTAHYRNEIDQGFISIEKLRLGFKDWITDPAFGDPFASVYYGDYSLAHLGFPEWPRFKSTYFAKVHINHPVLLALRMMRILSLEPDALDIIKDNPQLLDTLKYWIDDFFHGKTHKGSRFYFGQFKFKEFFNSNLEKSWRQSPDPNLTIELWKRAGIFDKFSQCPLNEPFRSTILGIQNTTSATAALPNAHQLKHLLLNPSALSDENFLIFSAESEDEYFKALSDGFWVRPRKKDKVGQVFPLANPTEFFKHNSANKTPKYLVKVFLKPQTVVVDISKGAGLKHWSKFDGNPRDYAAVMGAEVVRVSGKASQANTFLLSKDSIEKVEPFDIREFESLSQTRPRKTCFASLTSLLPKL